MIEVSVVEQVRGFLRSLGFSDAGLLGGLTERLSEGLSSSTPNVREGLEARVAAWLAPHFDPMPRERLFSAIRLAFLSTGAAQRWPKAFLAEAPAALVAALRNALLVVTPPEAPAAMPEQSLAPAQWIVQLHQLWSPQAQGSWNS